MAQEQKLINICLPTFRHTPSPQHAGFLAQPGAFIAICATEDSTRMLPLQTQDNRCADAQQSNCADEGRTL